MRIFVIGSGGREHALGWALARSRHRPALYFAPGNPGTQALGENVPAGPTGPEALVRAALDLRVDLAVVGPEAPLAAGVVDRFASAGVPIVGPSRAAARVESSKVFAKELMDEAGIPTAPWRAFDDPSAALAHVRAADRPLVVKADGLAAGKGVVVCGDAREAASAITRMMVEGAFGEAGRRVVIEDRLDGEELSALALTDGRAIRLVPFARDHKRLLDGDRGPNTGGMGAVAPVPLDPATARLAAGVLQRAVDALAARGTPFRGILYAGLMLARDGPRVLEFNCRFGDPEAQAVLPLLASDPVDALLATVEGGVGDLDLRWTDGAAVAVVLAARGYPASPERGAAIQGLDELPADVLAFHGGTAVERGRLVTAGGRVLTVVARGATVDSARARALAAAGMVRFDGKQHRTDVGRSLEERSAVAAPGSTGGSP